jgi:hypothetical protein
MNIEDYREYCLSLGADVEEKLPFQKFFLKQSCKAERKSGQGVLGYPPRDYQSRGFLPSTSWDTCFHSSTATISLLSRSNASQTALKT